MHKKEAMNRKQIILTLLMFTSTAWAGPFEDADAAHSRKDYAEAVRLYKQAAVNEDRISQYNRAHIAISQYNLGQMYREGQGVVKDYSEAAKWYKLAAVQGLPNAQYNLGQMYIKGQGVLEDYSEGAKWNKLAAAQGNANAQYSLGLMFSTGLGVPVNDVRAHMWFNLAAVQGHAGAAKAREAANSEMTPQQRGEAQKLAKECLARNFKGCD